MAWLWLVLWGAAFVLREEEEIRLDLLTARLGRRGRIGVAIVAALAVAGLFALALPATWSYISFMKVERTSYLKLRFDWLYSIYLVFTVAVIGRCLWKLGAVLRGREPAVAETPAEGYRP